MLSKHLLNEYITICNYAINNTNEFNTNNVLDVTKEELDKI